MHGPNTLTRFHALFVMGFVLWQCTVIIEGVGVVAHVFDAGPFKALYVDIPTDYHNMYTECQNLDTTVLKINSSYQFNKLQDVLNRVYYKNHEVWLDAELRHNAYSWRSGSLIKTINFLTEDGEPDFSAQKCANSLGNCLLLVEGNRNWDLLQNHMLIDDCCEEERYFLCAYEPAHPLSAPTTPVLTYRADLSELKCDTPDTSPFTQLTYRWRMDDWLYQVTTGFEGEGSKLPITINSPDGHTFSCAVITEYGVMSLLSNLITVSSPTTATPSTTTGGSDPNTEDKDGNGTNTTENTNSTDFYFQDDIDDYDSEISYSVSTTGIPHSTSYPMGSSEGFNEMSAVSDSQTDLQPSYDPFLSSEDTLSDSQQGTPYDPWMFTEDYNYNSTEFYYLDEYYLYDNSTNSSEIGYNVSTIDDLPTSTPLPDTTTGSGGSWSGGTWGGSNTGTTNQQTNDYPGGGTGSGGTPDGNTSGTGSGGTSDGNTSGTGPGGTSDGNTSGTGSGGTSDGNTSGTGSGGTTDGNTSGTGSGGTTDGNSNTGGAISNLVFPHLTVNFTFVTPNVQQAALTCWMGPSVSDYVIWYRDGLIIGSSINPLLLMSNQTDSAGEYRCRVYFHIVYHLGVDDANYFTQRALVFWQFNATGNNGTYSSSSSAPIQSSTVVPSGSVTSSTTPQFTTSTDTATNNVVYPHVTVYYTSITPEIRQANFSCWIGANVSEYVTWYRNGSVIDNSPAQLIVKSNETNVTGNYSCLVYFLFSYSYLGVSGGSLISDSVQLSWQHNDTASPALPPSNSSTFGSTPAVLLTASSNTQNMISSQATSHSVLLLSPTSAIVSTSNNGQLNTQSTWMTAVVQPTTQASTAEPMGSSSTQTTSLNMLLPATTSLQTSPGLQTTTPTASQNRPLLKSTYSSVYSDYPVRLSCQSTAPHIASYVFIKLNVAMPNQFTVLYQGYNGNLTITNVKKEQEGQYACYFVDIHDDLSLLSNTLNLTVLVEFSLCSCPCPAASLLNTSSHDVEKMTSNIIDTLSVPTANLSSRLRQITSAQDSRSSSMGMGVLALVFMSLLALVIVAVDGSGIFVFGWTSLMKIFGRANGDRNE